MGGTRDNTRACGRHASLAMAASGAAAVACASAAYYAWMRWKKATQKYRVPPEIASSYCGKQVTEAVRLALKAGANMVSYCEEKGTDAEVEHDLSFKGKPEDFCTQIDVENEQMVMEGILQTFPSHKIIGEETTGTGPIPELTKEPTWIIDPIDGTTNFASGLPLTCVSIGYCELGKPVMGVVFAPMTDEIYIAVRGIGAFRNGSKITRRPSTFVKPLKDSVVCFELGYPRGQEALVTMLGAVQRIMEHGCRATRQTGTGVLDLCYVATGRFDAVYSGLAGEGWKPWDLAAGYVIALEAGCAVEAIYQKEKDAEFDIYSDNHIFAVSKNLLQTIRKLVTKK